MRIALAGDFDTYLVRGLERPAELLPYRLSPGLNLLRGLQEIGGHDVHVIISTGEVRKPTVESGPFGTVHRLPRPRFSGSASFFCWRRQLILKQLRLIQPDIVHGQGTELEYGLSAVTSHRPNVITIHGILHRVHAVDPPPFFSLSHVPRWIETFVVRRARHVICLSAEVERFLREQGSPARCHRIPNAVAPCFFGVNSVLQPADDPALLFVGTIYPLKGLVHLVEALPAVRQRLGRPVRLRIVGATGGGKQAAEYAKLVHARARECDVAGEIEWLGTVGENGIAALLSRSHALVLPSFQETSPMAVAEAMAAAVPVVAGRAGGTPEVVDDGVTGLLVTPGQTAELAEALCRLLADAGLRQRMAAAARAKALASYAPRVVAGKTIQVYEQICHGQDS